MAIDLLAAGWPQQLNREQIAVYVEMLADIPPDELVVTIRNLIATADFRPSVAQIRRTVIESRGLIPTEGEAVEQKRDLDEWHDARMVPLGAQGRVLARPEVHPLVLEAWKVAGEDSYQSVFVKAFREQRERFVRATAVEKLNQVAIGRGTDDEGFSG